MPGIDFQLQFLDDRGVYDWIINSDGDLATFDAFDTAIIVSLFTDARADASEIIEAHRRRGWAGNLLTPGRTMGGKLWLWRDQSRLTPRTANGMSSAAEEALAWFVEDGWTTQPPEAQSLLTGRETATLDLTFHRPSGVVEHRHFDLWEQTGDTLGFSS